MIPRDEIISMAREADASFETAESMFKFAALVEARAAAAEREACVLLCLRLDAELDKYPSDCSKAIRARGAA